MTDHVQTRRFGGVLRVTLARPDKKNALTAAMYEALIAALREAGHDRDIGAVMIEGSGGSFTAGNDIADFLQQATQSSDNAALRFIREIATCDAPIVAAVEGVAVGVGTTMLLHCDLVYAAPSAYFRMPFVDLGLVPEAAASLLVPRLVGMAKATELLMLSEPFDAQAAKDFGIINDVVEASVLAETALNKAQALAAKPRGALRVTRRLMRRDRAAILARIDEEAFEFGKALASDEARAAFTAFMTKAKS